jgi:hypothetical protein
MGWKTNTILVRPALLGVGPDELVGRLGYEKRRKIKDEPFATAGSGSIWIGMIGDCVVVYTPFAWHFFDGLPDDPNDKDFAFFKSALFRQFHDAKIVGLILDSRVDAWGYAVFQSGALVRRSYGHDGTILGDEGSPLPSERAYFANCDRIDVDGEILYKSRSDPRCEPLSVAFHGAELVFEVCRSFTGYPLDAPELQQITGAAFWLNDDEDEFLALHGRRPWWKFWG